MRRHVLLVIALAGAVGALASGTAASDSVPFIESASLLQQVRAGAVVLFVDVRPPAEYEAGHIAGARSVPLDAIVRGARDLPREHNIVLYCGCPNSQAVMAYRTLMQAPPWPQLYVLRDGYDGWVANRGDVTVPRR